MHTQKKRVKFRGVQKWTKIGVAGRIEGRDRDRLKGNGETESLRPPELAGNRQKNINYYYYYYYYYY